jgi:alpha-glucosidase
MIRTDNYIRYTHVDSVTDTPTGVEAELHRERLRIDVVREDVVRVKISRGREFDETPTYAVCVDPLAEVPDFAVVRDEERVQVQTAACTVSLWLDPFRIDVHRADGTAVVETATDEEGRYWAYATLNDSFTLRRKCRQEDAIFGLGEKGGRHNRKGRDFTMWNIDVLSPFSTREFTEGKAPDDPRGDRRSADFDPFYANIPFFYHQDYPDGRMAGSFLDNSYRGGYEFSPTQEYRIHFRGGQYTEYIFAGPDMPAILSAYTWLTGRTAPPPLWALGYH